jgi:sortase (surface protein transpeptidase)
VDKFMVHGKKERKKEKNNNKKRSKNNKSRGSKGVEITIESYGKVEIPYINVDNF